MTTLWSLSSSLVSAPGVFWCVGPSSLQSHTPWITWTSGRGDHCNPQPPTSGKSLDLLPKGVGSAPASGQEPNPSVQTHCDPNEEEPPSSNISLFPDKWRVVCMGCPCCFISVLFHSGFSRTYMLFRVCTSSFVHFYWQPVSRISLVGIHDTFGQRFNIHEGVLQLFIVHHLS